jgi:hypothetical protein
MKHVSHSIAGGLVLAGVLVLAGCRTADQAHSGDMASLVISHHTEAEIRQATVAVFLENGFEQGNDLVFEKKATGMETAAYGGWSTNPVWIRLRVSITCPEQGRYIIGCNASLVKDRNQGLMEDEQRYTFQKRDECKNLLDQVKARLAAASVGSATK